jgi:hypothetical protein
MYSNVNLIPIIEKVNPSSDLGDDMEIDAEFRRHNMEIRDEFRYLMRTLFNDKRIRVTTDLKDLIYELDDYFENDTEKIYKNKDEIFPRLKIYKRIN